MKRGTILLTIGAFILALAAAGTFFADAVAGPMIVLGLAGLVVAGVGASQRWERPAR